MCAATLLKATNYYARAKPDSDTVTSLLVTPFQLGVLRCGGACLLLTMEFYYGSNRTSHTWVRYLLGIYTAACFSLGIAALCVAQRAPISLNLKHFIETLYCVSVALMIAGCYYTQDCINAIWFIIAHALLLPKIRFRPKIFLPLLVIHFPLVYKNMYSIVKAKYLAFPSIGNLGDIFHIFLVIYYKSTIFKSVSRNDQTRLCLAVSISSGLVYASCHFALKVEGYYYLIALFKNTVAQRFLNTQLKFYNKNEGKPPGISKPPWFSKTFSKYTAKKTPSRIAPASVPIKKPVSPRSKNRQKQQNQAGWFR